MSDLLFRPITELAELVRSGEVSSRELVEESLARIDEVDGEINAFTFTDPDAALAAADKVASGDERPTLNIPPSIAHSIDMRFSTAATTSMSSGRVPFTSISPPVTAATTAQLPASM